MGSHPFYRMPGTQTLRAYSFFSLSNKYLWAFVILNMSQILVPLTFISNFQGIIGYTFRIFHLKSLFSWVLLIYCFPVTQLCLFVTPWTAACQVSLSFTISQSLLKLTSIELMMPSNYLILHHPLLFLPSIFPSIRVFSNESILLIGWPKFWSFSFNISPSNEYSGLVSFRIDWRY